MKQGPAFKSVECLTLFSDLPVSFVDTVVAFGHYQGTCLAEAIAAAAAGCWEMAAWRGNRLGCLVVSRIPVGHRILMKADTCFGPLMSCWGRVASYHFGLVVVVAPMG